MNFEEKVAQLEDISKKISDDNVGLEESLSLYRQGVELTKECLEILNENKLKVKEISNEMAMLFEEK